jgi:alanine dehydrogenase
VRQLSSAGHQVVIQAGAGEGSAVSDDEYRGAGAEIVEEASLVWERAEMIVKVKEPIAAEYPHLRQGQILFTYLHLASSRELTDAIIDSGCIAIGYETVQLSDGSLPLLIPMSEVAGRLAVLDGNHYLARFHKGRGTLLSGVPGVPPANVVIIGGGIVGQNAARMAVGVGADVKILDNDARKLRYIDDVFHGNIITYMSNQMMIEELCADADLVVGAVLLPGAAAPKLVTEDVVRSMHPGAVIVDVAIDQGGSVETMRPTTHSDPVFIEHDVVHYAVTNMPAAVPRTSTWALTNATLPYALEIAEKGWRAACTEDEALKLGLQIVDGKCVYPGVAETFDLPYVDPGEVLA